MDKHLYQYLQLVKSRYLHQAEILAMNKIPKLAKHFARKIMSPWRTTIWEQWRTNDRNPTVTNLLLRRVQKHIILMMSYNKIEPTVKHKHERIRK